MYSLQPETKLDIFKFLNFDKLFSIQRTNRYFRDFINEYEGELARFKFDSIDLVIYMNNNISSYNLPIPYIHKSIEEMKITRYCFKQLFNCAFGYASFNSAIFNPFMIKLLFDEDTIPLRFHTQLSYMRSFRNLSLNSWSLTNNFDIILKFFMDHLNSECLSIDFNNLEKDINKLFNILINEGNKFPKVWYGYFHLPKLYDLIINYIATSTDCTKVVDHIVLKFSNDPILKLSDRAVKIRKERQVDFYNITKYQIVNIHNPKVRFSCSNTECDDGSIFWVDIKRIRR
uniref:F-box domain-containing protein n=1 Tax=Meloidogyne hapla TaxID=6305 RepID=A0A1I8C278_MELHA